MKKNEKISEKVNRAGWFTFWIGLAAVVMSHGIKVFEKKEPRRSIYDYCFDSQGNLVEVVKDQ